MQTQTTATSPRISSAPPLLPGGDLFSHTPAVRQPDRAVQLIAAAEDLLAVLSQGHALAAPALRSAMVGAFGASDAEGAWNWKDVYEAQELAALLFVRKYRGALERREPMAVLATLEKLQSPLTTTQPVETPPPQSCTPALTRKASKPG